MTTVDPGPDLAHRVISTLTRLGATLGVAESLTGGRLAAALTGVPGASAVFRAGVVAYATETKHSLLGVDPEILADHGAVAAPTAEAMAVGVAQRTGSTWGAATTGVAGPDPQEGHPVGTVFVAVTGPDRTVVRELSLVGDRASIQRQTVQHALTLLLEQAGGE